MDSRRGQPPHPRPLGALLVEPAEQYPEVPHVRLGPLPEVADAVRLRGRGVDQAKAKGEAIDRIEVIGGSAPGSRDRWQPGRHRLETAESESLRPRRQDEGVQAAQQPDEMGIGQEAGDDAHTRVIGRREWELVDALEEEANWLRRGEFLAEGAYQNVGPLSSREGAESA